MDDAVLIAEAALFLGRRLEQMPKTDAKAFGDSNAPAVADLTGGGTNLCELCLQKLNAAKYTVIGLFGLKLKNDIIYGRRPEPKGFDMCSSGIRVGDFRRIRSGPYKAEPAGIEIITKVVLYGRNEQLELSYNSLHI